MRVRPMLFLAVAVVAGCAEPEDVLTRFDGASRTRWEALSGDETAIVSLWMARVPDPLPNLTEGTREVMRTIDHSVLVQVPVGDLSGLASVTGVVRAAVWGYTDDVRKVDRFLQHDLLESWEAEDEPVVMLAQFEADAEDLRSRLESGGATVRTVAGPVVTLEAPPSAVFAMLTMPDLLLLRKPRELQPQGG